MLSLLFLKTVCASVIFFCTMVFGVIPFLKSTKKEVHEWLWAESLATGIFLGAGILHLLPDAATAFSKAGYQYPVAFLLAMSSFFVLLLFEHLSASYEKRQSQFMGQLALMAAAMLSVHSYFEGAAVGLANVAATAILLFIAIMAHKGAAAFALAVKLNQSQLSALARYAAFAFFALMTPLGIFTGTLISHSFAHLQIAIASLNALAAGTFLYIGSLHGLERAPLIRHCCNMREFGLMLLGFLLMAVLGMMI